MKTTVLIIFFGVVISINLDGQFDNKHKLYEEQHNNSLILTPYPHDSSYNKLYKKINLPDNAIINPDFDIWKKHNNDESPSINRFKDKLIAEEYPGSDIYYARRPYRTMPYEKSFILKPDPTVKYYLIIKDPISKKIIK